MKCLLVRKRISRRTLITALLLLICLCQKQGAAANRILAAPSQRYRQALPPVVGSLRGGESSKKATKKKKKAKKKKPTMKKPADSKKEKKRIEQVLKEKDAAQAVGDAIRDRADVLRQENPLLDSIDSSVSSVGWAMGASDQRRIEEQQAAEEDESGGVEAAPTSVLAHYFLKSHGGAHALQCLCSLLSTFAGAGCLLLPKGSPLSFTLMKRCMLFAMIKHVSGLLAASFLAARAIPEVGLRRARVWMEQLAADPVSQYVFYAACVLLWLPTAQPSRPLWWQKYGTVPPLLVGPVLLREVVSTCLVISDVLVLWSCSSSNDGAKAVVKSLLAVSQSTVNAVMSILVTPKVWRNADAKQRQAILAKLTSKLSLAMEVAVGLLLVADAGWSVIEFSFAAVDKRPPVLQLARRLLCMRMYVHFLWTRRKKVDRLATSIRGGAAQLPFYMLDILMNPRASMGLENNPKAIQNEESEERRWTWNDYLQVALGLDDEAR